MQKNGGKIVGEDEGHFFVRIPKNMQIDDYIELYKNGGYIKEMRKYVGHAPILTCATEREHVDEMMRGLAEVGDVRERNADVGVSRERLQPPRPVEGQGGAVLLDRVVFRHDLLDLEGRQVDRDAVERRRPLEAVGRVERDGEAAGVLQFGDERKRKELAAAEREAEVVIEKDLLHDAAPALRGFLSLLAAK